MSFKKYSVSMSAFDRYYDQFLQNSFSSKRFRITLLSGDSAEGIPTAGSVINPFDPNASFRFRTADGKMYRIPFAELQEAVSIEPVICMVHTVDPSMRAGGDFSAEMTEPEAERLLMADAPITVSARTQPNTPYVDGAPRDYYKYLTIRGTEFAIKEIKRSGANEVSITAERH